MKNRIINAGAALLFTLLAVPAFAVQRGVVDDVIRMTKAGVAEDTMLDFVAKGDARFDVTADDVIAMNDANVPKMVIKAVVNEATARGEYRGDDRRTDARPATTVYVNTPRVVYDPYYYDPFWYAPRLYLGFGFGSYWGGGYRGHYNGGGHGGSHGGGHSGGHGGRH
jgi:hypothetical protein